jgi:hypothetical protein
MTSMLQIIQKFVIMCLLENEFSVTEVTITDEILNSWLKGSQ